MKLIKLEANQESFHTVNFYPQGISLIIGRKMANAPVNPKRTYNSVGKSLMIKLIHFCLGSNSVDIFQKFLPNWEFTLTFEISGELFSVTRAVDNQKELIVNGDTLSVRKFNQLFARKAFSINEDDEKKFLGFRPLISRFIRPSKSSYVSYDTYVEKEQDYAKQICNAYLLGLDIDRAIKKYQLKEKLDNIELAKKNFANDVVLNSFFQQKKEVETEIVNLSERVEQLDKNIKLFNVAEDYGTIKKEADEITLKIKQLRNQASLLRRSISNVEQSLAIQPDISKSNILRFYEEASVNLPDMIVKTLEEVEVFNQKIIRDRNKRLGEERKKLHKDLKSLEASIDLLSKQEDEKLKYLNTHGALEEYVALNEQLSSFKVRLEKLKMYKDMTKQYQNKAASTKIEFQQEYIDTNNYLIQANPIIEHNISTFKSLANEFYENKVAGIEVINNDGENKLRFDISAKIQDDAGDGVGAVKIFCFDWTILKNQYNHNVKFIFHDSRLIDGMDPRQIATVFKVAHKNCLENGFQYIISVNEDRLESMKDYFSVDEYEEIITKSKALELTDESEQAKLLGIEVDMEYELETTY